MCENRLRSLHHRMLRQPELLQEYDQIIQQQIRDRIIETVPDDEIENTDSKSVHYLPHHGVVRRDRETTKLRIVYDGSAKPLEREYSLNDCLETGPNFTRQLFDTLVKFRWHRIGLTADIEKAFLMVAIKDKDKNMVRFLWLRDPNDPNSELVQLRFIRLVFGLRPSPAILSSIIRHHLEMQKDSDPQLIGLLKKSLYVDDFNFVDLINEAKSLPPTKRSLLKISAKIFDPLGLISPLTIQWKVLFQLLCNESVEWDDELSDEHLKKWDLLISDLHSLNNVCVPRCYFEMDEKVHSVQIHCFSDASERSYAAVTYLHPKYESGLVDVNLMASKTSVAKKQSIPRLELLGANILARLSNNIQNTSELSEDVEVFYWMD